MVRRWGLWVALGLALHAAAFSRHWSELARAFACDDLDYAARRELHGFGGFPISIAAAALDAHLGLEVPVRLSPALHANEFLHQRLSEGLHPRVVSSRAEATLRLAARERFDPSRHTEVAPLGADGVVYLRGILPRRARSEPVREGFAFDPIAGLAALAASAGLGGAAALRLRRPLGLDPALLPALALPLAALLAGLVASLASWLQLSLGARALAPIGWALLPIAALAVARDPRLRRDLVAAWRPRRPEAWLLAIFLAASIAALALFPIVGWDGRSVWLFQAKRLYFDGILTARAASDPDAQWSHTSYPLLVPAWMAFATSLSPVYNERLIGIGVGLLFAAELWLVWILARGCLGRGPGAAFAAALALGLATPTSQGFSDGHLTLLLVAQVLAALGGAPGLAWVLALAASLTKLEGLVLSASAAAVCAFACPPPGARSARARLLPWLVFAPAAIHVAWGGALGLQGDFDGVRWSAALAEAPGRAAAVVRALPGLLAGDPLLIEGAVALALLAGAGLRGGRPTRIARAVLAIAAAFTAFALGAMAVTPKDVEWHVANALGRLLLHPAALFVLALLLCVAPRRAPEQRSPAGPTLDDPGPGV
jgi:hypothetical protein